MVIIRPPAIYGPRDRAGLTLFRWTRRGILPLPPARGAHRIRNVHRNVPGVLRDVNKIVSDLNANIRTQVLATDPNIGYLIMDLDQDVSNEVNKAIGMLDTSIRTRILY